MCKIWASQGGLYVLESYWMQVASSENEKGDSQGSQIVVFYYIMHMRLKYVLRPLSVLEVKNLFFVFIFSFVNAWFCKIANNLCKVHTDSSA